MRPATKAEGKAQLATQTAKRARRLVVACTKFARQAGPVASAVFGVSVVAFERCKVGVCAEKSRARFQAKKVGLTHAGAHVGTSFQV